MKNRFSRFTTLSVSCCLLGISQLWADVSDTPVDYTARLQGLDKKIEKARSDFNLPGLAVAVVADGKVIKAKGYGYRDTNQKLLATADTQYSIGSSTKAFNSFMLGTLVDEGVLEWDVAVKNYLPQFAMHDDYASNHVTLRDMLSHRTGLPRHMLVWLADYHLTIGELLGKLPHLELSKELREGFAYNNLMYAISGHVAEVVTGQTWSSLIQNRILHKLKMNNTSLGYQQMRMSDDYALPYLEEQKTLKLTDFNKSIDGVMQPAGGINSSVNDMSKWLQVLLNEGQYKSQQLLQKGTLEQLQSPQVVARGVFKEVDSSPVSYGLGWFTRTYRGHYQVEYGGNIDGYTSAVFTYPVQRVGIAVLTNKDSSLLPKALAKEISDHLFAFEEQDHLTKALEKKHKSIEQLHLPDKSQSKNRRHIKRPFELSEYAGTYYHPGYGELDVSIVENGLKIKFMDVKVQFEHDTFNTFICKSTMWMGFFKNEKLNFEINRNGIVAGVHVPFELKGIKFIRRIDSYLTNN